VISVFHKEVPENCVFLDYYESNNPEERSSRYTVICLVRIYLVISFHVSTTVATTTTTTTTTTYY